jgi:uncharacterized protein (DUF427 family)
MWKYRGQERPPFADKPKPGQESVWDYPRPPAVKSSDRLLVVKLGKVEIARSARAYRVMETASPPGFEVIKDCTCFYPGRVECYVDRERVRPQPGYSYGGWITDEIAGPAKGERGTEGW